LFRKGQKGQEGIRKSVSRPLQNTLPSKVANQSRSTTSDWRYGVVCPGFRKTRVPWWSEGNACPLIAIGVGVSSLGARCRRLFVVPAASAIICIHVFGQRYGWCLSVLTLRATDQSRLSPSQSSDSAALGRDSRDKLHFFCFSI
jgi:hypothetical protein